jgi:hypothetical protein
MAHHQGNPPLAETVLHAGGFPSAHGQASNAVCDDLTSSVVSGAFADLQAHLLPAEQPAELK